MTEHFATYFTHNPITHAQAIEQGLVPIDHKTGAPSAAYTKGRQLAEQHLAPKAATINQDTGSFSLKAKPTYTVINDNVGLQEHLDDVVTPVEINFIPKHKKGSEWVKEALDYYMQELAGKSIPIGNTGYTLHIKASKNRAKLATYNTNTQARSAAFKQMKEIISKSYRLGSEPAQSREKESSFRSNQVAHTATFERFGYPVKVDGEIRMFWFTGQTKTANNKNVLLAESGMSEATKGDTALTWSSQDATMPPRRLTLGDTLANVKGKIKGVPEIIKPPSQQETPDSAPATFSLRRSTERRRTVGGAALFKKKSPLCC